MSVTFPPKITGAQLRSLARLCGKTRTGTKAAIQERIVDDLRTFQPLAPGTRVLSIDLGIRNLAYSLLEVPGSHEAQASESSARPRGRRRKEGMPPAASSDGKPILRAWERLALIPKTPPKPTKKSNKKEKNSQKEDVTEPDTTDVIPTAKSKPRKTKKASPPPPESTDESSDEAAIAAAVAAKDDPSTSAVLVEDFSPARLSLLAVDLITNRLLPLRPDIVIMEQQRFRSQGGSAVFEWTLRVNSLESMLYAVLATMRAVGRWRPDGRLEGVVARNVLEFMAVQEFGGNGGENRLVGEKEVELDIWDKQKRGDNKKLKKDIVGRMLRSRNRVRIAEEAEAVEEVAREYLEKWERMGKRGKTGANVKKMDDLADCLLQGIAFIRWQENKTKLLEGGVDALADQMLLE